jgi:hypothetical protein
MSSITHAIEQMAGQQKPSPAQLAAELGLIGGFQSTEAAHAEPAPPIHHMTAAQA